MKLYRKIEEKLKEWKNSNYSLIVFGSRQVGKTYIINNFIEENFNSTYYLNLYQNTNAIETIINSTDTKDFLLRLSILNTENQIVNDTCIFIDEIQEYYTYIEKHNISRYYDLLTASKFIAQDTKNRIVFSGSLLRLEMNSILSSPTGYMLPLEMYPLDFEEFLIAMNVNKELISIARDCFINKKEIPDYIHVAFMNYFKKYLLVGGMPKAVSEYIDTNSFVAVENAHKTIDYYIKDDILKYTSDNEKLRVNEIYELLPSELSRINKRFIISHIPDHNKNEAEHLSFSWLNTAGVSISVYVAKEAKIPLLQSSVRNQFKFFHEDIGILTHILMDAQTKAKVLNGDLNINFGAICENFVAEELHAHGFKRQYYYNSKKNGEVDFLIEQNGEVIPLEIKSGKNYTKHSALNNLFKTGDIKQAYVFTNNNYSRKGNVHYFPIYCIDFITK